MTWLASAFVASGSNDAALPLTGYQPYVPASGMTIDGVAWSSLAAGTRILLLNQGGSPEIANASNGIWLYSGNIGSAHPFTRPINTGDYVHGGVLDNETVTRVSSGGTRTHTTYACVTQGSITIDTTLIAHSRQFTKVNVKDFGAKGNSAAAESGVMTVGSSTLSISASFFGAADVGKTIVVTGAGASGANLITTIASYVSAGQVALAVAALTTVASASIHWGNDDSAAIISAYSSIALSSGILVFPSGSYFVGTTITIPPDVQVEFEQGATLAPLTSAHLTIGGPINARSTQHIFGGYGGLSAVTSSGSPTPPTIAISGLPTGAFSFKLQVLSGTSLSGGIIFQYSLNGGTGWSSSQLAIAATGYFPFALVNTGVTVRFPSSTSYASGQVWSWTSTSPVLVTALAADEFPVAWWGALGIAGDDYSGAISNADASIPAGDLVFGQGTYTFYASFTTSNRSDFHFRAGAMLVAEQAQLVISGRIRAHPLQQIFSGFSGLSAVTGTGPSVSVSGLPQLYTYAIQIIEGGLLGAMTFRYSLNSGNWSLPVATTGGSPFVYSIPGTGLTVTFPNEAYSGAGPAQNTYAWTASAGVVLSRQAAETFPVEWWGAKGDDATTNDTAIAQMNSSLAQLDGEAFSIQFSSGIYFFMNTIAAFPDGCRLAGQGARGYSSFLEFGGTGVFLQSAGDQRYEDLTIIGMTHNAVSGNPAQEAVILGVTADTMTNAIVVHTAAGHSYSVGDLINIYGVLGVVGINSDPASPWVVSSVSGNAFELAGSSFSGSYPTPSSIGVTGATQNGIYVELTTSVPHGLVDDQLVFVSGLTPYVITPTGTPAGQYRILVVDATHVNLYVNEFTGTNGSGSSVGAGTISWGGIACSNSNIPLIGLNIQGPGPLYGPGTVSVRNCSFGGFKYGISVDGAECISVTGCNFDQNSLNSGYTNSSFADNRSHSACGIRIGSFNNTEQAVASMISISECQFASFAVGILHRDGTQHFVSKCNYENRVMAILQNNLIGVVYDRFQTETSRKVLIQVYSDSLEHVHPTAITVQNGFASGDANSGLLGTPPSLDGLYASPSAITFANNSWYGVNPPIRAFGAASIWYGPFFAQGNYFGSFTLADFSMIAAPQGPVSALGTLINHAGDVAQAALDIAVISFASPGMTISTSGYLFHQHGVPEGGLLASSQDFDQLFGAVTSTSSVSARFGSRRAFVSLAAGASATSFGAFSPIPREGALTLTVKVAAWLYGNDGHSARWELKQQAKIDGSSNVTLLGVATYTFKEDLDGSFPDPSLLVVANQVAVQAIGYPGAVSNWSSTTSYEYTGY